MSVTNLSAADNAIPEIWAARVLRDMLRKSDWAGLSGQPGMGHPITRYEEILNGPGDKINVTTTSALVGAGKTDEQTLEGQEEALSLGTTQLTPVLYRHAVRMGRLAAQKSVVDLREEAKVRLAEWAAVKIDNARFTAATLSSGSPNVSYSAGRSSIGTVAVGDKLTAAEVMGVRKVMITQNATPLVAKNGSPMFGMFITPKQHYDLQQDSGYNTAVLQGSPRGAENEWFSGSVAVIAGVALFVSTRVPTATDGAASAQVARNPVFGAEALIEGWGNNVSWDEDHFDYGGEFGVAIKFGFQAKRGLAKQNLLFYCASS